MTFRVLITDHAWPDLDLEIQLIERAGGTAIVAPDGDEQTLTDLAGDVVGIATNWAKVTPSVIEAASQLRIVSRFGIGIDNIAVAACTHRKIPVTNCPDYCVAEVADHTLGLILALARNIAFFHLRSKQGEYNLQNGHPMRRLSTQRLGLVGFGRIAQAVFHRARAFEFDVVSYSPSGRDSGTGCAMVSLDELFATSDFVSLHAPLNSASRQMIGARQLGQMKSTACLINTSRGGLIDHAALRDAVLNGKIAGAALDVFDPEPPDLSLPLFRDERVIVTPHAAFVSRESLEFMRRQAIEQLIAGVLGQRPQNVINPQIWNEPG